MDPAVTNFKYAYMRLDAIRAMLARCPVAIQPAGLLEWHGEHNAVGLDGLKAEYICERAILLLGGGALMPVDWIGTYGYIRYPGTVCFDNEATRSVFTQMFQQYVKIGFKVIVVVTGHYGEHQMRVLRSARDIAAGDARKKGLDVRLLAYRDPDLDPAIDSGDHARRGETSMLMKVGQARGIDLVDLSGFQTGNVHVPRYPIDDPAVPVREPEPWTWNEDLKNPAACSADHGEFLIARKATALALELIENLHEIGIDYVPPSPILEYT